MPYPLSGENQKQYIKRSIPLFMGEGYKQKEAVGRAYGFWKTYKGKKRSKLFKGSK